MTREQAKDEVRGYLRQYVESITIKSKTGKYVCPLCNSGLGRKKTGAFSIAEGGQKWRCFSCGKSGDIIDLIGLYEDLDARESFDRAYSMFGLRIDATPRGKNEKGATEKMKDNTESNGIMAAYYRRIGETAAGESTFRPFLLQAQEGIESPAALAYLSKRGISLETAKKYGLGYVDAWKHPKAGNMVKSTPRLIIPVSEYNYLARDTRDEIPAAEQDYEKSKVTARNNLSWTFNAGALETVKQPVFVVEGEIDALSIIDAGGAAVGLGSTAYTKQFIKAVTAAGRREPLIIALDNDEPGQQAAAEISSELTALQVPFIIADPCGGADPNDALTKDRDAFITWIKGNEKRAQEEFKAEHMKACAGNYIDAFIDEIQASKDTPFYPTGFSELDKILDDGLRPGLYCVGAISSLGKTTFALQISDYIAKCGHDVLYFSLEQSRRELMAKSISRETMAIDMQQTKKAERAKTTLGILTGKYYERYSEGEKELIRDAVDAYRQYSNHIFIHEGTGDIGAKQIRDEIAQHIFFTGSRPVVFIDYLQILAPWIDEQHQGRNLTDKQSVDKNVLELRRICRDYKIPVFCISSFNRESYTEPVNMTAFKESGAVEYGSDVLIGLQYAGMDYRTKPKKDENTGKQKAVYETPAEHTARVRQLLADNKDKAAQGKPQAVEIKVLKNRNGKTDSCRIDFYPRFNRFVEWITGNPDAVNYFMRAGGSE